MKKIIILLLICIFLLGCQNKDDKIDEKGLACSENAWNETHLMRMSTGCGQGSFNRWYIFPNGEILFANCGGGPYCWNSNASTWGTATSVKSAKLESQDYAKLLEHFGNFDWDEYRTNMSEIERTSHCGRYLYLQNMEPITVPLPSPEQEERWPTFISEILEKYGPLAERCPN